MNEPPTWGDLFARGARAAPDLTVESVRHALETVRADRRDDRSSSSEDDRPTPVDPSPATVVADADTLVADVLVGGDARDALDHLRRHSWTTLVASDVLLDDAEATLSALVGDADASLPADWRTTVDRWRRPVTHPSGDHPALASAYRGGAMHLLTFDERLSSVRAGTSLQGRVPLSVRPPKAFATLFDAESLHTEVGDGDYGGPDRDPRGAL